MSTDLDYSPFLIASRGTCFAMPFRRGNPMRLVASILGAAGFFLQAAPLSAETSAAVAAARTPAGVLLAQTNDNQASAQQLFAQAFNAKAAGDLEGSERMFEQGLVLDPGNALARKFLLEVRQSRENARVLFAQGYDAKQAGDLQAAQRMFDAGLKIEPGNVSAQKLLAETRLQLGAASPAIAAGGDPAKAIQQVLESRYRPSKANADETDIEAMGGTVSLQRSSLVLSPVFRKGKRNRVRASNVYENGSIRPQGVVSELGSISAQLGHLMNREDTSVARMFSAGDKMLITRIEVRDGEVVFNLMSNVINGDRFSGTLRFKFADRDAGAPEQAASLVGQVLRAE